MLQICESMQYKSASQEIKVGKLPTALFHSSCKRKFANWSGILIDSNQTV